MRGTPRKDLIEEDKGSNFVIYAKVSYLERYPSGKTIRNPHELIDLLNEVKNGKDKLTKAIRMKLLKLFP